MSKDTGFTWMCTDRKDSDDKWISPSEQLNPAVSLSLMLFLLVGSFLPCGDFGTQPPFFLWPWHSVGSHHDCIQMVKRETDWHACLFKNLEVTYIPFIHFSFTIARFVASSRNKSLWNFYFLAESYLPGHRSVPGMITSSLCAPPFCQDGRWW